ncbi:LOW QUALITY PROTEIN: trafficking protein particle complex subunit brun [Tachypleus tridentatus]|uniref:LOW QUALITY PROTEIN: trafficking protein particle complex subunit brun n=1 Tax=Tachypleus tridentatus TaxID=6853 RepID=UPI003FD38220
MTGPDYNQRVEDHRTLLILVKYKGLHMSSKNFNKVFDRISRLQYVKVPDSQAAGGQRVVWVRYKKHYSVESNEWGDFQTHRKVLGLLCLGKCGNQSELEELCKYHNLLREKYDITVLDSRCLVFGIPSGSLSPSSSHSASSEKFSQDDQNSPVSVHLKPDQDGQLLSSMEESPEKLFGTGLEPIPKIGENADDKDSGVFDQPCSLANSDSTRISSKDPLSILSETHHSSEDEENTDHQMGSSTFTVDSCQRDISPSSEVSTPSSGESPFGGFSAFVDFTNMSSSLGSRKLIVPPTLKSKGTHCILYNSIDDCDYLEEDLTEFISSLFYVVESKRLDRSFEKQDKLTLLMAPFERKDYVGLDMDGRNYKRRCLGRMKKHIGDLALQAGLPLEALTMYVSAVEQLKSVNDWLWLAATYEGQCSASAILLYPNLTCALPPLQRNSSFPVGIPNAGMKSRSASNTRSLPNGLDPTEYKTLGKSILTPEEIIEKFKEGIFQYSKFRGAAFIEAECSIKAVRVLILQEKYLLASEFLQNLIFMNMQESDEDRVLRFSALSQLYNEIGFHRKAAFFKRVAAMRCVATQNPNSNWQQCYQLLLQTVEGYKISMDPKEFLQDAPQGWPVIQVHILQELVGTARSMGNQALAVRHMTFLLHTMLDHLPLSDRREFCAQLESLTSKCEGAPVPLALDNGYIIPPVNLLNLPKVKSFKLQNMAPHLRPVKKKSVRFKSVSKPSSPFIFSPILSTTDRAQKNDSKVDFKWIEGDVCEVALQVCNPLPFELKVTHMGLLADGIAFESFPACLSLPAESGPYPVNLLGTPRGTGELQILGYTTHVLGVKSNCRLRDLPTIKKPFYSIEVLPALPQLELVTSLPKASTFSSLTDSSHVVVTAAVTMFAGESQESTITLTNSGCEPVEKVDIGLHSKLDKATQETFFTWSKENLDTQLPILPGNSASFTLYIRALGDFVLSPKEPLSDKSETGSPAHGSSKGLSSRTSSNSSLLDTPQRRKISNIASPEPYPPKIVEVLLQLQYSGGPGGKTDYCRQCAIAITVEVIPSVVITKWDVLPAEVSSHCYLVFDVLNATCHEMELQYTSSKQMLIEANDTCRIPIPVERCPISAASFQVDEEKVGGDGRAAELETVCKQHLANLVDLQWQLPTLEISGRASIADVMWTPVMLDNILVSPLHWDISLNDRPFKVEEEVSFLVGELVLLSITIHNLSDVCLQALYLSVCCYQDHQNGQCSYRMENLRAVVGTDKILVDKIEPQETYQHQCGFVFFFTGVFKLDIHCTSTKYHGVGAMVGSVVEEQPRGLLNRSARGGRLLDGKCSSMFSNDTEENRHIWKCTPSIEITITES